MEQREVKALKLTGSLDGRTLTGKAAGIGNIDRGGDVIAPGAFASAVPGFLKSGGVLPGHDWAGNWIAMPKELREEGDALVMVAEFHTTDEAETVLKVVTERLAKGLDVGLSIGFRVGEALQFESVAKLKEHCDKAGITVEVGEWDAPCRLITKVAELYEVSVVTVPMNPKATVTNVKARKSLENTVGSLLQARIHQSFTVAADELAVRGYMDTDERIALSGLIGQCLSAFRDGMDAAVASRVVAPGDVDWVASKSWTPNTLFIERFGGDGSRAGLPLSDHLDTVLAVVSGAARRLDGYAQTRQAEGRPVSPDRLAQAKAVHSELGRLIAQAEAPTDGAEDVGLRAAAFLLGD